MPGTGNVARARRLVPRERGERRCGASQRRHARFERGTFGSRGARVPSRRARVTAFSARSGIRRHSMLSPSSSRWARRPAEQLPSGCARTARQGSIRREPRAGNRSQTRLPVSTRLHSTPGEFRDPAIPASAPICIFEVTIGLRPQGCAFTWARRKLESTGCVLDQHLHRPHAGESCPSIHALAAGSCR